MNNDPTPNAPTRSHLARLAAGGDYVAACRPDAPGPVYAHPDAVTCPDCRDIIDCIEKPAREDGIPASVLATARDVAGHIITDRHYARALALAVAEDAIKGNVDDHLRRLLKVSGALAHYANVLDD